MSTDPLHDSDVLADLTSRRESLNARMSNIDSEIGGIRSLLDDHAIPKKIQSAPEEENRAVPVLQARQSIVPALESVDRRKKLNEPSVYVNPHPEWSRMAKGKSLGRKKNSTRCPKCGSCDTRRSQTRGFFDILLCLFDFTNSRCRNCNARFRVWRTGKTAEQQDFTEPVRETE